VSRFGSQALDATCDARLRAATTAAIDRYLQRVGVTESLAAVFEDGRSHRLARGVPGRRDRPRFAAHDGVVTVDAGRRALHRGD
jgi:hypothetical protein